jgi:hypothetical protein
MRPWQASSGYFCMRKECSNARSLSDRLALHNRNNRPKQPLAEELLRYPTTWHASAPGSIPELARIVSCWHCKTSTIVDLLMHATGASGANVEDNPYLNLKAQVETLSTSLMVALDDLGEILGSFRQDVMQ